MKCLQRASARFIIACLPLALISLNSSPPAGAQQTPDADSVALTVTVKDKKGNFIGGLTKGDFAVYDNKVPQEVSFFAARDEPLSVGVILDLSPSTADWGGHQLRDAGEGLMRFAELGHPENDYFLIGFAAMPQVLADWTRGGAAFRERLSKFKTVDRVGKRSALYDACYLGVEKLSTGTHPKRVLILISDGMENGSRYTLKELKEAFRQSDVLLYAVGISSLPPAFAGTAPSSITSGGSNSVRSLSEEGWAIMDELASLSGGAAFFPDNKKEKMVAAMEALAVELRHQYLLGFKPQGSKADGKWHRLKVTLKLSAGNLSVRTREGYYAAPSLPGLKKP